MAIDVTDATFQTEVVDASTTQPVVVDLWAEWCGPCKQLGPIIEDVVAATGGQVKLVKVDVDQSPAVSQAFNVQSIPAVYALKDGKVVDGFIGAQPREMVAEFVNKLVPTQAETEVDRLLAAGDRASVEAALGIEPDNPDAVCALAAIMVSDGENEAALELLARIPETLETRQIAAIARAGDDLSDDIDSQLTELLPQVKADDDARQRYVDLLDILGPDDPRTAEYRKKLTSALF